jgi:ABC-type polysaccharide/polyol phosphate export permease
MNRTDEIYDSTHRRNPLIEEILILIKYRDLVRQFVTSSLKTRYKRSVLGILWTLLNPLLMMLVLTIVFSSIFRFQLENYAVYILSGLIAWNLFATSTTASMQGMALGGGLLNRIYVPKSIFTVSAVGTGLVNLGLSIIPLISIMLILRVKITPAVLVLPVSVILLVIFSLGMGLILSAAAVFFADMLPVYEVLLLLWFYATPIIYPPDVVPEKIAWIFQLNPMTHLITIFREPIYNGVVPELYEWVISAIFALLIFILGGLIFTARSNEYAYRT